MSAKVQSSSVALAVLSLPALSHVRPVMPLEMAPHTVLALLFPPTPCSAAARLLSLKAKPCSGGSHAHLRPRVAGGSVWLQWGDGSVLIIDLKGWEL